MKKTILSIFMLAMIIGACNEEEMLPKVELTEIIEQKSTIEVDDTPTCHFVCPPLYFDVIVKNPTSIQIEWVKKTTRGVYKAEISTSSNFSSILQSSGFVAELDSHTFENLHLDTKYYVRVVYYTKRTSVPGGVTAYSPTYTATTQKGIPDLSNVTKSVSRVYSYFIAGEYDYVASLNIYAPSFSEVVSPLQQCELNRYTGDLNCNYGYQYDALFQGTYDNAWRQYPRNEIYQASSNKVYVYFSNCETKRLKIRVRTVWPGTSSAWSDWSDFGIQPFINLCED